MKALIWTAFLSCFVVLGAGCDDDDELTTGSLSGEVALRAEIVDEVGHPTGEFTLTPVEGATVELYRSGERVARTTSVAEGAFSLRDVEAGDYELLALVADRRDSTARGVTVSPGMEADLADVLEIVTPVAVDPVDRPTEPSVAVHPTPAYVGLTVRCAIPAESAVQILILNGGDVVRTLIDGVLGAGLHEIFWDRGDDAGDPVPDGAYWVLLRAAGEEALAPIVWEAPPELSEDTRAFIDQHWSEDEFRSALNAGQLEGFFPWYGPGSDLEDIWLYVSKDDDPDAWYTNAILWDVFAWGWREYWDEAWNLAHHPALIGEDVYSPQPDLSEGWFFEDDALGTPLREEARAMSGMD